MLKISHLPSSILVEPLPELPTFRAYIVGDKLGPGRLKQH